MDEQRAEFEAWAKKAGWPHHFTSWNTKDPNGYSQESWEPWKAATQRQQERIAKLEAALQLARGKVAYMASGMTHANWKTMEVQKTLDAIDTAIAAGKGEG